MTPEDTALALSFACPICAAQPPTPCPHMADRLAQAESMQPRGTSAPTADAFDQAVEESGLV